MEGAGNRQSDGEDVYTHDYSSFSSVRYNSTILERSECFDWHPVKTHINSITLLVNFRMIYLGFTKLLSRISHLHCSSLIEGLMAFI